MPVKRSRSLALVSAGGIPGGVRPPAAASPAETDPARQSATAAQVARVTVYIASATTSEAEAACGPETEAESRAEGPAPMSVPAVGVAGWAMAQRGPWPVMREVEVPRYFAATPPDDEAIAWRGRRASAPLLACVVGAAIILLAVLIRMGGWGRAPVEALDTSAAAATQVEAPILAPTAAPEVVAGAPDEPSAPVADTGEAARRAPARAPRASTARRSSAPHASRSRSATELVRQATNATLRGDLQAGADLYERAIAKDRRDAAAWRGRGLALERLGQKRQARVALKMALQLTPAGPAASKIRERLEALE